MTDFIKILPNYLVKRYQSWKKNEFQKNKRFYKKIANKPQKPQTMVISCCDSRIHVTSILGAKKGEFFIHRNIGNLIPPYNSNSNDHGTSAAVEYAVNNLKVSNIIIMGHSNCGGIISGYNLFQKNNKKEKSIFINKWLKILKPAYDKVQKTSFTNNSKDAIKELEKESIKNSINNLIAFPFVKESLKKNNLILHGLWHDIETGSIESLDSKSEKFVKI